MRSVRRFSALLLLLGCAPKEGAAPAVDSAVTLLPDTVVVGSPSVGVPAANATGPLSAATRELCARIVATAREYYRVHEPTATLVSYADTTFSWPGDPDRPACGYRIGGDHIPTLENQTGGPGLPGEDLGTDVRFMADGPLGGTTGYRRPGATCVEEIFDDGPGDDEEDSTPADTIPRAWDWRRAVLCFTVTDPNPDEGPVWAVSFDSARGGFDGLMVRCLPFPTHTVIEYLVPAGMRKTIVRPAARASCDTTVATGDYEVPLGMMARALGIKDGVLFLERRVRDAEGVILIDLKDHHLIYQAPVTQISGQAPTGMFGAYRRFPRAAADPRCPATSGEIPFVDSLFYVDIHTGASRYSGRNHCPGNYD